MASMLRSGKFVRYFAGLTRSILLNTFREGEGSLVQNKQCTCSIFSHGFTTVVPKPDQNLDRSLRRLDQDVRRTGRISRRDIEEVLEEIRNQRSATSSQSLLVIRCCGNLVPEELPEVRTALVQEIWKTLNALNIPMDISHYNALLRVYLENEHQFSPTDFLADLEAKGIEPNRVTYQRLIARYCQQGDIEGATRILEFMKEKQLPVNEHVFNSLILGHSQANDLESATGILSVMKQAGLEPTADTYTTLLCCYGRHGDLDAIMKTLEECEKNEVHLLDKDILDVIYALTINGHQDKIDPLIGKIRKSAGYNQDAVNTVLRLTNKGYEDVAFKILQTMPRPVKGDGELADVGTFFIRQLVKANRPIEKILKICNELQEKGLNTKALLIATETSLTNGITNLAYPLLKELKNNGLPVRQHFFWPLICSVGPDQVLNVLRDMNNEFGLPPNGETIREYAIPNLKEPNFDKVISLLKTSGVSTATAASSAIYNALLENKLKVAADIASSVNAFYNPGLFRKPLIQALGKTKDFDSYIRLVRQIYDNLPRIANLKQQQQQQEEDEEESGTSGSLQYNQAEVLGQIIYDAATYFKSNRVESLEKILSGLVEQGLSISNAQAERIQERIGSNMNTTISELLGKLSAGDLEPVTIEKPEKQRRSGFENMSVEELEKIIEMQEAKNENTKGLKRYLLNACFKSKNLEKTEQILKKLEAENYVLTTGVYAQLIELYCHHNKLNEALQIYEKTKSKEPDFVLDNLKTIKVVDLMIKNQQIDEAIRFLDKNKKESNEVNEQSFNYNTTCWRILNSLAEAGKVEDLKKLFDALESKNYIQVNNVLLGPLVKVHLINNDLKKAVDTFEEICNKYQATPWKNELACRLIQAEDATNLQRLTDLSTNIHGEVNSLYDLVFSFVECGRIRQARKILETPGLRNRPQRINSACERYRQEGMVQSLEGLAEATKDLNHIDRSDIYYNLLLSYCKDDQPEKALGLWTKMQEEDITPSDVFLVKLAEFLKGKNIEVPFVVPELKTQQERKPSTTKSSSSTQKTTSEPKISTPLQNFKKSLRSGDVDTSLALKKQLSNEDAKLSVTDLSMLIENLVKADRVTEATKILNELLDQNLHPIPRIFKFYLNKLAASGDIMTLDGIGKKIDPELKKVISFDNRYCHANIVSGKTENYLTKLSDDLDKAKTDEEIKVVIEKFPRGGAFGMLQQHPELCGKFEEVAEKYASKGGYSPMNVLWIHYFINGNDEKCKGIFNKYLRSAPRLMFQKILQKAREEQNEELINKLISSYLKETKISEAAMGNVYSCYLDILTHKDKYDEALELLKKAIDDVCLENFNRTALMRIKNGLKSKGKSFPYKIPEKNTRNADTSSSSTSSSSSDDDVQPSVPETKPIKPETPKP